MYLQVSGDLEREEGAGEEVEIASSGATLAMLDKAVLGGVSCLDVFLRGAFKSNFWKKLGIWPN